MTYVRNDLMTIHSCLENRISMPVDLQNADCVSLTLVTTIA